MKRTKNKFEKLKQNAQKEIIDRDIKGTKDRVRRFNGRNDIFEKITENFLNNHQTEDIH